jgi:hypothetical protein
MADLSRPSAQEGTVEQPSAFWKFCRLLGSRATVEAEDSSFDETAIEAILLADTEDEMWEADNRGPIGGNKLQGVEMQLLEVEVKFSRSSGNEMRSVFIDPETGRPFYILVTAVRIDDDPRYNPAIKQNDKFVFNTSAPRLVSKIVWLEQHGILSETVVMVEGIELGGGQEVLKLHPVRNAWGRNS